jgi:hypothetical protein
MPGAAHSSEGARRGRFGVAATVFLPMEAPVFLQTTGSD